MPIVQVAAQYLAPILAEKGVEMLKKRFADRKVDQGHVDVPQQTWDQTVASAQGWADSTGDHSGENRVHVHTRMADGQWVAGGEGRISCGVGAPAEINLMVETAKMRGWNEITLGGSPSFQQAAGEAFQAAGIEVAAQQVLKGAAPALRMG